MTNCTQAQRYELALWRTPGVGPIKFFQLWKMFPQLEDLFKASPAQLKALGLPELILQGLLKPNWEAVDQDTLWLENPAHHLITWQSPLYPPLLKQIVSAPPLLFVKGDPHTLMPWQLAMVGSRNPTPLGLDIARQFACHLSLAGFTITSGLALGIDAICHHSALASNGKTIAVLGCGLDKIYPLANRKLAEKIADQGALISEFPLGTPAIAENFPRRNRIVSGLSLGVLVVEASLRSGSLITARLAGEQGREVFAIPGSIHNPLSKGCHHLIRQGAKLVETAQDIIEELGPLTAAANRLPLENAPAVPLTTDKNILAAHHQQLLECVGFEPTTLDELAARSGLPLSDITSAVLILELKNYISTVPGGYMRRASQSSLHNSLEAEG